VNAWGFLLPAALAALLSLALTPVVRALALRIGAVDLPSARKIHRLPVPAMGGLAVVASGTIVLAGRYAYGVPPVNPQWASASVNLGLLLGLLPILGMSVWDDIRPLGAWPKLLGQSVGAALAISLGIVLDPTVHLFEAPVHIGAFAVPLSFLWLVGVTNAFNIIDGLDGLSAGLAFISASTLVGVFLFAGRTDTALVAAVLAGALLGFLPYNMHPARVFLGDTGANALGFLLGCLTLQGGSTLSAGLATLLPLVLLGVPIADTALSVCRRLLRRLQGDAGARVFNADLNHIHHRLLASGLSHRTSVWLLYGIAASLAAVALLSLMFTARETGFLLVATLGAGYVGMKKLGYEEFALVRHDRVARPFNAPVLTRSFFHAFIDLVLLACSIVLAVWLRFDRWALALDMRLLSYQAFSMLAPSAMIAFAAGGMYRGPWRIDDLRDVLRASRVVLESTVVAACLAPLLYETPPPISLFVVYTFLMLAAVNGARFLTGAVVRGYSRARRVEPPAVVYTARRAA